MRDEPRCSVFVGNYPLSWTTRDILDLFERNAGPVDRVDMKDKYAFVIFKNPQDADQAIKSLDDYDTGRNRLKVEMAKGDNRKRDVEPTTNVVFVVNFDKERTREEDIERFFQGFPVEDIEMWRGGKGIASKNYCFVTLRDVESAREAIQTLDGKYIGDRQVTVEPKTGNREPPRRGDRDRDRDYRRDDRDRDRRRDSRDRRGGKSDYASLPERGGRRDERREDRRDERRSDRRDDRREERRDDRRRDDRDSGRKEKDFGKEYGKKYGGGDDRRDNRDRDRRDDRRDDRRRDSRDRNRRRSFD